MFTEESIMQEILGFLDYRKNIMKEPYVIVGEKFKDMLVEHFDNKNEQYKIENVEENYRFILLTSAK